ncbi:MAG: polysaccharide deacetylase family protein [Candidatus Omnitrophica bacterium]|nr:polysaccharide deacetylase family protein [Candidatus Omnitrophota bacterium]
MKKIKIFFSLLILSLGMFYFFWLSPKYTVPILMYHNIGYEEGSFYVAPENFAKQMEYIKNKGYEVITLDELVQGIKNNKSFKRNKVVITFDDGYRDNFQYAYPVLKKFGFPATIFIISDFVGKSFGNGKEFLNWDQIILMSKDDISFGAHTKTHFNLGSRVDEPVAQEEIMGSKNAIEEKIKLPVEYFCYPSGGFNEKTKEMIKQAGFKGACSTNRGFAKFNRDEYELKRIKVTNSDMTKPFSFYAKLSGFYTIFKRNRDPY